MVTHAGRRSGFGFGSALLQIIPSEGRFRARGSDLLPTTILHYDDNVTSLISCEEAFSGFRFRNTPALPLLPMVPSLATRMPVFFTAHNKT